MNTKTRGSKRPSDPDVKCIRRATRGAFHPKIKSASSFLGLRGDDSITQLCRMLPSEASFGSIRSARACPKRRGTNDVATEVARCPRLLAGKHSPDSPSMRLSRQLMIGVPLMAPISCITRIAVFNTCPVSIPSGWQKLESSLLSSASATVRQRLSQNDQRTLQGLA